jgi:hypothetical protein
MDNFALWNQLSVCHLSRYCHRWAICPSELGQHIVRSKLKQEHHLTSETRRDATQSDVNFHLCLVATQMYILCTQYPVQIVNPTCIPLAVCR